MLIFEDVTKSYPGPGGRIEVLAGLNLRVRAGELAVVQGASGCGKSTLLFIAGGLLRPDRGTVRFADRTPYSLSNARRNRFRAANVGFIFQRFHLIPYLSVEENVRWPLHWSDDPIRDGRRIPELCEKLGFHRRLGHLPAQLSVGEQQRVAVARALLGDRKLICADEPTGNLDETNSRLIAEILREEADRGCTVLFVTHEKRWASMADLHLRLDSLSAAEADHES